MSKQHQDYDVIVLGYGSAGGNAALQAAHLGAKVLLIDKEAHPGGNSFVSSANMTCPTDFYQKPKDDGKLFARYLDEVAQGTTPKPVIDAFVEGLYEMPSWLKELGAELEVNSFERMWTYYIPPITFPKLETAKDLDLQVYHVKQTDRCPAPTAGRRVWELLDSHIRKQENVTVKTETNIKKISRNHSGGIKGVTLNDGTSISAPTLIVACGGFEANNGLKRDLLGPRRIGLLGSPANTGDGVRLAEKVGARIWHHAAEASVLGFLPPDTDTGFALALRHPGFIFVNRHGERFINECKLESHRGHSDTAVLDHETGTYVHDPIWLIMDEENMNHDSAPVLDIFSNKVVREGYQWSKYSKDEIEKGWVQKADSVEQLAETLDIDSEKLETNIEKYNKHPKETPDPFNRDPASLRPLHPPFYALRLTPLLYNTQAGPQRNEFAEVIDPDGEVIPGLYGAGECGSIWGHAYQSSTNFAETIVFGRIAGREAARFARRLDAGEHEQRKTEAGDPPTKVPEDQFEKS